jgi:DNA (cytosine-5)-methyltransferase 1
VKLPNRDSNKPRLLDLFCGAGGATKGYQRAGFHVTGVDLAPQPRYCGDEFVQADALTFTIGRGDFDAIHASPPCQHATRLGALQHGKVYPRLIAPMRMILSGTEVPWVIENVEGAELRDPITLCGSAFGLGVRRHRLFEFSERPTFWPQCEHDLQPEPVDVTGSGGPFNGERKAPGGGVSRKPRNIAHAREVMGIDWMTRAELSEAIPPAYTEWVGKELLRVLRVAA